MERVKKFSYRCTGYKGASIIGCAFFIARAVHTKNRFVHHDSTNLRVENQSVQKKLHFLRKWKKILEIAYGR